MTVGIQRHLFPQMAHTQLVNVASVPQRSPFRYPGGKTWLIPRIRQWLYARPVRPAALIEPFAGGGIVSLTAAFEELAHHVVMVEKDDAVSAVWETVLNGGNKRLAERIIGFDITPETVHNELSKSNVTLEEKAFQTILRNRVNHGGILAPGTGILKHGENGKGITSRWYPETLRKRILAIGEVKERITFIHGDGMAVLKTHAGHEDVVYFIDPPYTAAGKRAGRRLYVHNELDHSALFELVDSLSGDFLMTYDNAEGVEDLARKHNFDTQTIMMKNTHHARMTELLIGRDLDWVRRS